MPLPVSLRKVADMIDACPQEWTVYLSRKTGELIMIPGEYSVADRDEDECKEDLERIENAPEEFVTLPEQRDLREYDMMEAFCDTVADERKQERLRDAISGKGAFRRFKDMVDRLGVRDDWFAFTQRAYAAAVRKFLEFNDIPFKDDVARG